MKRPTTPAASGFSLLEIVVSVGIFSVVLIIVLGIFSQFIALQRSHIAEQTLQEDIRFALELFNREVRTGYGDTYAAPQDDTLFFRNQAGSCVSYTRADNQIVRGEATAASSEGDCASQSYEYVPLTSTKVEYQQLQFQAIASTDAEQGRVTVQLTAVPQAVAAEPVTIQSTATSRQLIPYEPQDD